MIQCFVEVSNLMIWFLIPPPHKHTFPAQLTRVLSLICTLSHQSSATCFAHSHHTPAPRPRSRLPARAAQPVQSSCAHPDAKWPTP